MQKNLLFIVLGVFVLIVAVFVLKPSPQPPASVNPIGEKIDLARVGMFGKPTTFGVVKVPLLKAPSQSETYILNVAIDLNNDGKFAAYALEKETQPEWVVQNMPVRFTALKNGFSFFFPDLNVESMHGAHGVSLRAVLGIHVIEGTAWDGAVPAQASSRDVQATIVFEDVGNLQSPAAGRDGSFGFFYNDGVVSFATPVSAQGAAEINVFHPDVPDITQGTNECAPTSAANSLLWLGRQHNFSDKLPDQATLISELKNDMRWNNGIQPTDYVPGKNAITTRRGLPLVNHQIGAMDGTGTFAAMAEELKKGQDVEMRIQYKDASGNPTGGHWVTVVGLEQMSNGTQIIDIHDPLSPGPSLLQRYRLDATTNGTLVANYPYGRAYVSFAVAESYQTPTTTTTTAPPPTTGTTTTSPPAVTTPPPTTPPPSTTTTLPQPPPSTSTQKLQVIQYGGKYLPVSQLIVESEGNCGNHYHAAQGVVLATDGTQVPDPGPPCGYGATAMTPIILIDDPAQH